MQIKIPKDADLHYFVLLLKIKKQRNYAGPNLVAFIKVNEPEKLKEDEEREKKKLVKSDPQFIDKLASSS